MYRTELTVFLVAVFVAAGLCGKIRKPIRAIPHAQLDRLRVTVCAELRAREIAGSVILQSVVTAHSSRSS